VRAHDITGGPGWLIDVLALTRLRLQIPTCQWSLARTRAINDHPGKSKDDGGRGQRS
jgi:hypothetical protein